MLQLCNNKERGVAYRTMSYNKMESAISNRKRSDANLSKILRLAEALCKHLNHVQNVQNQGRQKSTQERFAIVSHINTQVSKLKKK